MNRLKVAAIQFPVVGDISFEAFQKKVEDFLIDAKKQGVGLVVFPELITLDLVHDSTPQELADVAREYTPRYFKKLQSWAQQYHLSIMGGSSPQLKNGEIYNTAFLALPDGRNFQQDKLFLTPFEKEWGWKSGKDLKVFDAPWGRTTMLICYDCEFPAVSNQLSTFHPDVILVPSMTEGSQGFHRVRWSAQARAIEHYAYVIHTGTVGGSEAVGPQYGRASFTTPQDEGFPGLITEGTLNQNQMVVADIDLELLRKKRKSAGMYPARDQEISKSTFKTILVK